MEKTQSSDSTLKSSPVSFCSQTCLQLYIQNLELAENIGQKLFNFKKIKMATVYVDECKTVFDSELIVMLHLMRCLTHCDHLKTVLDKWTDTTHYKYLESSQNLRGIEDLQFAVDLFLLALKQNLPPERSSAVMQRLKSICSAAKSSLSSNENSWPAEEQPGAIDREILLAIAKNCCDALLHIGREDSTSTALRDSNKENLDDKRCMNQEQAENGNHVSPVKIIDRNVSKYASTEDSSTQANEEETFSLEYLDLSEEKLFRSSLIVEENGGKKNRIHVLCQSPLYEDLTIQHVADVLKSENLFSLHEAIFIEKKTNSDNSDSRNPRFVFRVVAPFEPLTEFCQQKSQLFMCPTNLPRVKIDPRTHKVAHFTMDCGPAGTLDHFALVAHPSDFLHIQHDLATILTSRLVPGERGGKLSVDFTRVMQHFRGVQELFAGRAEEWKVCSFELGTADLHWDCREELRLYSEEEIAWVRERAAVVRRADFLEKMGRVAGGTETREVREKMEEWLGEASMGGVGVEEVEELRMLRCMRYLKLAAWRGSVRGLGWKDFLLGGEVPRKTCEEVEAVLGVGGLAGRAENSRRVQRVAEYELAPRAGRCLLQALESTRLPKIVCMKSDGMEGGGRESLGVFLRGEVELNSRVRYELRGVVEAEYDPRGVCTVVYADTEVVRDRVALDQLRSTVLSGRPPKNVYLVFELRSQWIYSSSFSQ